jgi:hypothetical protein
MNLYLIHQSSTNGYDTYDSAVVAAETEEEAQCIHPSGACYRGELNRDYWLEEKSDGSWRPTRYQDYSWAEKPSEVSAEFIGVAKEETQSGVICASFNAG